MGEIVYDMTLTKMNVYLPLFAMEPANAWATYNLSCTIRSIYLVKVYNGDWNGDIILEAIKGIYPRGNELILINDK